PLSKLIRAIHLSAEKKKGKLDPDSFLKFTQSNEGSLYKISIDISADIILEKLFLEIELEKTPGFWRGTDYSWKAIATSNLTANYHSPKILKFSDDTFVAATTT